MAELNDEQKKVHAGRIRLCMHPAPKAIGLGYASCDDCGALLPDEDPDLQAKAEGTFVP